MTQDVMFREELVVTKELFYNEQSMYGAYGFKFKGAVNSQIKLNPQWLNFSIAGNVPRLVEGNTYMVNFREGYDTKRNMDAYFFVKIESEGIKGKDANHEFIRAVLTEKQAETIIAEFPFNDELVNDILDNKVELTKIKGIGASHAESIIKKLSNVQKYSKAVVELSPLGASIKAIERLVQHFKSVDMLLKQIERNIYSLTEVDGFGFKKVDEYALNSGMELNDSRRIAAGATYVIDTVVEQGSTKIPIRKFEESLCKILDIDEVDDETFDTILNNKDIYYEKGVISLNKYLEEELEIIEHFRRLRDNFEPVVTVEEIEREIELAEANLGFKYNEKQREAIVKATQSGVMVIDGKAGSGKSSLLRPVINSLPHSYISVALSGKAVNVLAQNGLVASTIHRALKVNMNTGGFENNEQSPLYQKTVIIDESSMVNNHLFLSLLKAIETGAQIIVVGDSGQLPSIGRGAVLTSLLNSTEFAHTTLTEVHRQAADSGTLSVANEVREGKEFLSYGDVGVKVFGNNKDFYYFGYNDKTLIQKDIYNTVKRFIDNPEKNKDDLQIITSLKERGELSVKALNTLLQPLFNPETLSGDEITTSKYTYRKGDRVIQQGNNYKAKVMSKEDFEFLAQHGRDEYNARQREFRIAALENGQEEAFIQQEVGIFNGTFGKIIDLDAATGMLIEFEDCEEGIYIYYDINDTEQPINSLELGYAITTHRSQGSGFDTVFIAMTFNEYMLLSRQLLYTAMTRTINQCFLFAETKAAIYAVKKNSDTRSVFMSDYLK